MITTASDNLMASYSEDCRTQLEYNQGQLNCCSGDEVNFPAFEQFCPQ